MNKETKRNAGAKPLATRNSEKGCAVKRSLHWDCIQHCHCKPFLPYQSILIWKHTQKSERAVDLQFKAAVLQREAAIKFDIKASSTSGNRKQFYQIQKSKVESTARNDMEWPPSIDQRRKKRLSKCSLKNWTLKKKILIFFTRQQRSHHVQDITNIWRSFWSPSEAENTRNLAWRGLTHLEIP